MPKPFSNMTISMLDAFKKLHTPCYVIDENAIEANCKKLQSVIEKTGCKILLAQKAFSNFTYYPLISKYLSGTEASGLFEARLGREEMPNKEVHVFCGAYKEEDFDELLEYADHIVFNSINQLKKFGLKAKEAGKSIGLRINPECSTQDGHEIYDPCAKGSRLGVTKEVFDKEMDEKTLALLDGIHFHTLCEQNSDALEITFKAVEEKFSSVLKKMKWINMGGGHHITRDDYDVEKLISIVNYAKEKYGATIYLEPGEAIALNAGYLVTKVLDVVENSGIKNLVLDASAACHMPDVIEMPYMPPVYNAEKGSDGKYTYRLTGPTCLAGDVIGDYSFDKEIKEGDFLIFGDMAIYSMCKNNTFNGMPLPTIYGIKNNEIKTIKKFNYSNFKNRLG